MERKQIEEGPNAVLCQKWEESERGWGTRPDGFSLHLSLEGLKRYIRSYWDSMPDEAPDEYSRPDGTPYLTGVSDSIKDQIEQAGNGLRYISIYEYPGSGGTDGWVPVRPSDNFE